MKTTMSGRMEHQLQNAEKARMIARRACNQDVIDFTESLLAAREPLTAVAYIQQIVYFFEEINKPTRSITSNDVTLYFNKIKYKTDKNGNIKAISQNTKQLCWNSLNRFFEFVMESGVIKSNPMRAIPKPKLTERKMEKYLTMEDLNKMLICAKNYHNPKDNYAMMGLRRIRDELILYTLMITGMRCTALTEINIEDVDLENKKLTIIDKRNKRFEYPLDDEFISMAKTHLYMWGVNRKYSDNSNAFFLGDFYNGKCKRITRNQVYNIVTFYSNLALGYKISPHKLRAAFITIFYEASGHDISATREAVGHVNIETTNRYIRRPNNARNDAVTIMTRGLKI